MEFVNVGSHCEAEGCNQQDFLPFQCQHCKKSLCLIHRTAIMHKCKKRFSDATSIDCPICRQSVKFFKGENIDEAWEKHYQTTCTKSSPAKKKIITCSVELCKTALSASNSFECGKCRALLCLTHRHPDSHKCISSASAATRSKFLRNMETQIKAKPATNNNDSSNNKSAAAKTMSENNSVHSTTSRRAKTKQDNGKGGRKATALECPFCADGKKWQEIQMLETHISSSHAEGGLGLVADTKSSSSAGATAENEEQCPTCGQRFTNIADLIEHVESKHQISSSKTKCSLS